MPQPRRVALTLVLAPLFVLLHACTGDDALLSRGVDPDLIDSGNVDPGPGVDASTPGDAATDGAACEPVTTLCGDTCRNLQTDKDHCGACGHDCGGGECSSGICQPVTIRDGLDRVWGVTTFGNAIFWYRARGAVGAVESCALGGCGGAPSVITNEVREPATNPRGITILSDGSYVQYIAHPNDPADPGDQVFACPVAGCVARSPTFVGAPGSEVWQLARSGSALTSDSTLYYTAATGGVRRCPFGTCTTDAPTPNVTKIITTDQDKIGMAVSPTRIYFQEAGGSSPGIYSCPLTGCNGPPVIPRVPLFQTTNGYAQHLTLAGTALVALSKDTLFACDTVVPCANKPTTLATGQASVTAIAGDDKNAYFAIGEAGRTDGEIRACALPTCAGGPRVLAKGLSNPTTLHVRDGMVYWSELGTAAVGSGAVRRVRP